MLDWIKQDSGHADHPMRNPALAAKLLADLRELEPLAALSDLSAWIEALKGPSNPDEKIRSEILSLIHEASGAHFGALMTRFLARPTDQQATYESDWNALNNYLTELAGALCASAGALLTKAGTDPPLRPAAAAGAARGLHACRMLAKTRFVRYASVPPKVWRAAYAVHAEAEKAECAATPVRMDAAHKTSTSVTQELLGLLMLQSSAPEMMSPEQIEVTDRVVEHLGAAFTLRPRGVADNPFCFDPASDSPPRRAAGEPVIPNMDIRYFGAGAGYDSLERLYKQVATTRTAEIMALGKDVPLYVQFLAIRHLGLFWGAASRYTPPARSPATGSLHVVRGYAQIWQRVSSARAATTELTLAEDDDGPAQAPETWTLQDTGGNELGAEIPQPSNNWARCGDVVGVSMLGDDQCWLGVIRSMHAEPGRSLHANIAILSRDPQAVQLRAVTANDEENVFSEELARQFAFNRVRAIILSDGSAGAQKPNFLLAPEHWKEGRVFEATLEGAARYVSSVQLLRRGDDYVRATFEWVEKPD